MIPVLKCRVRQTGLGEVGFPWLAGGEVCVCALLNKLRPACSSSLLVLSSENIFKFLRGTFSDTEK